MDKHVLLPKLHDGHTIIKNMILRVVYGATRMSIIENFYAEEIKWLKQNNIEFQLTETEEHNVFSFHTVSEAALFKMKWA